MNHLIRIIEIGILLFFIVLTIGINSCKNQTNKYATEEFYKVNINGCNEQLLIQSSDTLKNPILLYLHGGPGSSSMVYSYLYSDRLKEHFTFVNWDMRGAALSYHEGMDTTLISEKQIANDALTLIHYLMEKYHQKKIYLLGHSFGSVLGMYLVDNYSELFYAYIGVGQVMNFKESVAIEYDWLHDTLTKAKNTSALERIEQNHFPYIDLVVKYGGHHNLSINLDSVIMKSPYYFEGYLELLSNGKKFSSTYVGRNLKSFKNPDEIEKTSVPLYFFEGRNDHVIACAPELVVNYCNTIGAPLAKVIWFENSAHYVPVEEPMKFQEELIKILNETNKE